MGKIILPKTERHNNNNGNNNNNNNNNNDEDIGREGWMEEAKETEKHKEYLLHTRL